MRAPNNKGLTPDEIDEVIEQIGPPPDKRDQCRDDVERLHSWVMQRVEHVRTSKVFGSNKGKADLHRYKNALKELREAFNKLDPAIKPWFSLGETAYVSGKTWIDREFARVKEFERTQRPQPDAVRAKAAVAATYSLLCWWGRKPGCTRGGKWQKSAKIFAGGAYVFEHMCAFRKDPARLLIDRVKFKNAIVLRTRAADGSLHARLFGEN